MGRQAEPSGGGWPAGWPDRAVGRRLAGQTARRGRRATGAQGALVQVVQSVEGQHRREEVVAVDLAGRVARPSRRATIGGPDGQAWPSATIGGPDGQAESSGGGWPAGRRLAGSCGMDARLAEAPGSRTQPPRVGGGRPILKTGRATGPRSLPQPASRLRAGGSTRKRALAARIRTRGARHDPHPRDGMTAQVRGRRQRYKPTHEPHANAAHGR